MTLAEFLAHSRKKSGLTQKQIADELGYSSAQFVSNWERGLASIPLNMAKKFCKLTGAGRNILAMHLIERYSTEVRKALKTVPYEKSL